MKQKNIKLSKLIRLAKLARKDMENLNTYEPNLATACGVSSLHLMKLANKRGLYPSYVEGFHGKDYHSWIEYYGHIIDITATQFNRKHGYLDLALSVLPVHICGKNSFPYEVRKRTNSLSVAEGLLNKWDVYPEELKNIS